MQRRRVFLRESCARQWTAGFNFWYLSVCLQMCHQLCDEDNRHFDSREMIPSLIHPRLSLSKLLDLSKTITGGNNSFNAPQIWTLILWGTAGYKQKQKQKNPATNNNMWKCI